MAGETILVVEDNHALREGLKDILEQENYQVIEAAQGADALARMSLNAPDLILSDIGMPVMDGYAFFESVRSRPEWISIPFIFLTARREQEEVLAGKQLGAEDYLVKPITPDELLTAVRSRLSRSQQLLIAQLQQSYEASLIMLANAIEVRDPYTRGHVERVMNYALALARILGWESGALSQLRFGSILHDIGKIHVRESTLQKPGPLNSEEWEEIKQHPVFGVEMIRGVDYLSPAVPVILNHHERWNGSGYPAGLLGADIPLAARIVAVADSFDAMTTIRPYRPVMTPEKACLEITSQSGSQYDPRVVEAFRQAWDLQEIIAIFEAFP
jgi:putative two-component system response regulator